MLGMRPAPPWVATRTECRRDPYPLLVPPWPVASSDASTGPDEGGIPRSRYLHN